MSYLALGKKKIEIFSHLKWGHLYYQNYRVCLKSHQKEKVSYDHFIKSLDKVDLITKKQGYRLIHLFYESGHYFVKNEKIKSLEKNPLLGIDLYYEESETIDIASLNKKIKISLNEVDPFLFSHYKKSFIKGREELLRGECYQFNLTYPRYYKWKEELSFEAIFKKMISCGSDNLGAYAHGTFIPYLKKAYLSNSPECLFQGKRENDLLKLWAMPIKGTIKNEDQQTEKNWSILSKSKKDEGELNMIIDLLRNDLSKIEFPRSKVIKKQEMLKVPGLLHQYALIEVMLSLKTSLGQVLSSLFPGGSITGAPKKNVMSILDKLENGRERGFYTGSTVLIDEKRVAASINIRSGEFDFDHKMMKVFAGGGVTLLSNAEDEYGEMEAKRESFLSLF